IEQTLYISKRRIDIFRYLLHRVISGLLLLSDSIGVFGSFSRVMVIAFSFFNLLSLLLEIAIKFLDLGVDLVFLVFDGGFRDANLLSDRLIGIIQLALQCIWIITPKHLFDIGDLGLKSIDISLEGTSLLGVLFDFVLHLLKCTLLRFEVLFQGGRRGGHASWD